jgi:uncharacterized membrane protein YbjE (DUF340 family)
MKGSLVIIFFFVLGILVSYHDFEPIDFAAYNLSFVALCMLMLSVGISVGGDTKTLASFKNLDPRLMLLPLMTIVGTLLGCFGVSFLLKDRSIADCLAVGSGFGYYSLSSIIITEYKGAELGTIALLSNVIREVLALLCTPFLVLYFGKLAPISIGGATTMDTTLPIISRFSGKEYIVLAIFHGCVVDFSVPFLVTLFCSI